MKKLILTLIGISSISYANLEQNYDVSSMFKDVANQSVIDNQNFEYNKRNITITDLLNNENSDDTVQDLEEEVDRTDIVTVKNSLNTSELFFNNEQIPNPKDLVKVNDDFEFLNKEETEKLKNAVLADSMKNLNLSIKNNTKGKTVVTRSDLEQEKRRLEELKASLDIQKKQSRKELEKSFKVLTAKDFVKWK